MLRKVRIIKSVPKARTGYQVQGSLVNDVPAMGGADYNAYIGMPKPEVSKTLTAVPREVANLEAEGGETVVGNLDGSKMPSFKTIKGPRHSDGGVPLLLPEDSFIFSDTKSMKIADPKLLNMFGVKPKKGGYTPAELSKKYDINNYRKILQDPNSDKISRNTSEIMIKNYTMKLGALALAQESKKGFPQGIPLIARPYMEAMGLRDEDLIPELAQEERQESAQFEQQETPEYEQQEMPTQMPSGEPIAQPTPMQPMAQYGMSLGGYDMPFLPQAEYGMPMGTGMSQNYMGNPRFARGGDLPIAVDGTPRPKTVTKVDPEAYKQSTWETRSDEQGEYKYNQTRNQVEGRKEYQRQQAPSGGSNPNLINDLCRSMKTKGSTHFGKSAEEVLAYAGYKPGTSLYNKHIITLKACEQKGEVIKEEAIYTEQKPPSTDCPCKDAQGNVIPGKLAQKDKDGKCLPCEEKCICKKSDGTEYSPGMDANGNCKKCEEEIPDEGQDMSIETPPVREAEWWLQDTVNAAGAFGDLMSVRKQMPWEARVDLEEPRPTFLDPTRELAAQSEQANIASQATAQFAGPQALGARLSAIQGQGAAAAANTLSRINNQNVGIANQFEGQQVGIRNQEQMMNQQMANRVYDKNVIANQQFQNAKRAGRANVRQAYNTAVTNKWKTDALNQLYPDYQVSPSSGGRVYADPRAKTPQATQPEQTMEEYAATNAGKYDPTVFKQMLELKYSKKLGGPTMFQDGGYVYSVFPIVTL
jgi:hypothetical protein